MYQVVGNILAYGIGFRSSNNVLGYRVVEIETLKFSNITRDQAKKLFKSKSILGLDNAMKDDYGLATEGELGERCYPRYIKYVSGDIKPLPEDRETQILVCRIKYGYIVTDTSEMCKLYGIEKVLDTNSRGTYMIGSVPINILMPSITDNTKSTREIRYSNGDELIFKDSLSVTVDPKVVEVNTLLDMLDAGYYLTSNRDIIVEDPSIIRSVADNNAIKTLGKYGGFYGCPNLQIVKLGNTVRTLFRASLANCSSLEVVELGKSVTYIGENVFAYDKKLKKVKLNEGLMSIDKLAFYKNESLTELRIPSTIVKISPEFIDKCDNLKTLLVHKDKIHLFAKCPYRHLIKPYILKGER